MQILRRMIPDVRETVDERRRSDLFSCYAFGLATWKRGIVCVRRVEQPIILVILVLPRHHLVTWR